VGDRLCPGLAHDITDDVQGFQNDDRLADIAVNRVSLHWRVETLSRWARGFNGEKPQLGAAWEL
jgi:hypothetical protein